MGAGIGEALGMIASGSADEWRIRSLRPVARSTAHHGGNQGKGAADFVAAHRRQVFALQVNIGLVPLRQKQIVLQRRGGKHGAQTVLDGVDGIGKAHGNQFGRRMGQ